jgi:pectinesterase
VSARHPLFDTPLDALVDLAVDTATGGDTNGLPVYLRIQDALDAAPPDATQPYRIGIRRGTYVEKLVIDKPWITLIGEARDATVLRFGAASGHMAPSGPRWTTWGCATVIVRATDFSAQTLTIENSFDYPANHTKAASDPSRLTDPQAVALMTDTGADRTWLRHVRLIGYQDTLFVNAGRSYFEHVDISGHVDFIFGAGVAVFHDCDIVCRAHLDAMPMGWITAPSTNVRQPYGLLFNACRLLREPSVPDGAFALGRPWHPTTQFGDGRYADPDAIGCTVFAHCWMDAHISAHGWAPMHGTARDGRRVYFQPQDARFFEYRSAGPGAHACAERRQLSAHALATYAVECVLGDWRPYTRTEEFSSTTTPTNRPPRST